MGSLEQLRSRGMWTDSLVSRALHGALASAMVSSYLQRVSYQRVLGWRTIRTGATEPQDEDLHWDYTSATPSVDVGDSPCFRRLHIVLDFDYRHRDSAWTLLIAGGCRRIQTSAELGTREVNNRIELLCCHVRMSPTDCGTC